MLTPPFQEAGLLLLVPKRKEWGEIEKGDLTKAVEMAAHSKNKLDN